MRVLLIPVEGVVELRELDDAGDRLAQLQQLVGGFIELVPLTDGGGMLANEEGLLRDLPANPVATAVRDYWHAVGDQGGWSRWPIVGPAVLLGTAGAEFTSVPEALLEPFNGG